LSPVQKTLRALAEIARKEGRELHIVGGYVRDALLGRQSRDLDFVVSENADSFARRVAFLLRGSYDTLDSGPQLARVSLIADDGLPLVLDFSLRRGQEIAEDLCRRDFTVNAMAISLDSYLNERDWPGKIIDPCGGKSDLAAGLLRLTSEQSVRDDPVRLLRAVRFLHKLNLEFAPGTAQVLRRNARLIRYAYSQKLSIEFFKLLSGTHVAGNLRLLFEDLQVLPALYHPFAAMADTKFDGENLLTRGLRNCELLETFLLGDSVFSPGLSAGLQAHLQQELAAGRPRIAYLKLACILHEAEKINTRCAGKAHSLRIFKFETSGEMHISYLAKRLCLSAAERDYLVTLVNNRFRPLYIRMDEGMSPPLQRFFYQFRDCAPELVLLAMASQQADGGKNIQTASFAGILELFFAGAAEHLPKPLLSAEEVMEFFNLPPARQVGSLLEAAYAAQIEGKVTRRSEALSLISTLLEQVER
jgi:poly(A) polymerase